MRGRRLLGWCGGPNPLFHLGQKTLPEGPARHTTHTRSLGRNFLVQENSLRVFAKTLGTLKIQIFHTQRIGLNELAPWLDNVAHELGKQIVGLGHVFDLHLQERARVGV